MYICFKADPDRAPFTALGYKKVGLLVAQH